MRGLSWLCALCMLHGGLSESPPDISAVGVEQVKAWSTARVTQAESNYRGSRHPSPEDWSDEVVYQIQVDRFQNGNLSNDVLNLPPFQSSSQLASLPEWRHGGD